MSSEETKKLNEVQTNINIVFDEILLIDSLSQITTSETDSLDLNKKINVLMETLLPLEDELQQITDVLNDNTTAKVSEILLLINNINSDNDLIKNRLLINRIYLETFASDNFTLSENQSNELLSVASQCYYIGGDAVLEARAMYSSLVKPLEINDEKLCGSIAEGRNSNAFEKQISEVYDVKILPNPSKDRISIFVEGILPDAKIHLQVFDINGKKVKEMDALNGESISSQLNVGIYFCRITIGDTKTQPVKFTIIP
jgi:hypothetical protein